MTIVFAEMQLRHAYLLFCAEMQLMYAGEGGSDEDFQELVNEGTRGTRCSRGIERIEGLRYILKLFQFYVNMNLGLAVFVFEMFVKLNLVATFCYFVVD